MFQHKIIILILLTSPTFAFSPAEIVIGNYVATDVMEQSNYELEQAFEVIIIANTAIEIYDLCTGGNAALLDLGYGVAGWGLGSIINYGGE